MTALGWREDGCVGEATDEGPGVGHFVHQRKLAVTERRLTHTPLDRYGFTSRSGEGRHLPLTLTYSTFVRRVFVLQRQVGRAMSCVWHICDMRV